MGAWNLARPGGSGRPGTPRPPGDRRGHTGNVAAPNDAGGRERSYLISTIFRVARSAPAASR
jgi:hypothetical protein